MEYEKIITAMLIITECLWQPLVTAIFEPTLELDGCTRSKLRLTIRGASDSGIVYIQGPGTTCRQYTQAPVSHHIIDFNVCGIAWRETFKVMIQKKAIYQTGEDKQVAVTCIPDTRDLQVGNNVDVIDNDVDVRVNRTIKPTAIMSLYRDGVDVDGSIVKLTDEITMVVQLDKEYVEDFDIQAKECYADNIHIIKDGCPVDTELFPEFTGVLQGKLQSTFGAFRTTNIDGGTVKMPFTCTLQVYLGQQTPIACNTSDDTNADDRRRRQAVSRNVEAISVGTSVFIYIDDASLTNITQINKVECVGQDVFVGLAMLLVVLLVLVSIWGVYMYRRQQAQHAFIKKLGNNEAGSDLHLQQNFVGVKATDGELVLQQNDLINRYKHSCEMNMQWCE